MDPTAAEQAAEEVATRKAELVEPGQRRGIRRRARPERTAALAREEAAVE